MNCEEVKISLHDYIDGTLDDFQKKEIDSHLKSCNNCLTDYRKMKKFFETVKNLNFSADPPADLIQTFSNELLDRSIKDEKPEPVQSPVAELRKKEKKLFQRGKEELKPKAARKESFLSRTIMHADIPQILASSKINWGKIILILFPLVLMAVGYFIYDLQKYNSPWKVITNAGTITVNGRLNHSGKIEQGQSLFAGENSSATIRVPRVGNILVKQNSLLVLNKAKDGNNEVSLVKGALKVSNTFNMPDFTIKLKECTIFDRAGEFEMAIDSVDNSKITVNFGLVEMHRGDEIVFLDEGYSCEINKEYGIGIPYREKAPEEFKNYVRNYFRGDENAVDAIIRSADKEDMLTLLAMIPRSPRQKRVPLFQAIANYFPPPAGVTQMGIVKAETQSIYLWWQDIEWQL